MGTLQTNTTAMLPPVAAVPTCERCGAPMAPRRRASQQSGATCLACDQRARRAAYFQRYYETHKDRILAKNRRWAKENKARLVLLRLARQARLQASNVSPRVCVDCGTAVVRAARCRRCHIRHRYATDVEYRTRRLATTRRWLQRRARDRHTTPIGAAGTAT